MTEGYPNPPYEVSNIDYLRKVCEFVRDEPKSRDEIKENADISKSNKVVYLGLQLSFLEEREEGVSTTQTGVQLSYPSTDEVRLFREAIQKYPLYHDLLQVIYDKQNQLIQDEEYLPRSEIEKHLRISLGLEISDYKAEKSASTFLKTLEIANLGEYTIGRKGKPTRLEISSEFTDAISDLLSPPNDSEDSSSEPEPDTTVEQELTDSDQKAIQGELLEGFDEQTGINLDIQISLDGSDDPDNIRKLIFSIRKGLKQDLDDAESNSTEKSKDEINDRAEEEEESEENVDKDLSQFTEDQ